MQGQEGLEEDEAEAAFIDSFFLPGGILDPDDVGGDNNGNDNKYVSDDEIDVDDDLANITAIGSPGGKKNSLSPFPSPSRVPPQPQRELSPLPDLSDILNINPWDDANEKTTSTTAAAAAASVKPTVVPFINTASAEEGGNNNTHSLLLDPIATALNSTTNSSVTTTLMNDPTYSITSSPSPLSSLRQQQQPPSQEDQNNITLAGMSPGAANTFLPTETQTQLPPPMSLPPPGFDPSLSAPGAGPSSIMIRGSGSQQRQTQQQQKQSQQPQSNNSNTVTSPSVFDFETPASPPFSTPPRASPVGKKKKRKGGGGGGGGGREPGTPTTPGPTSPTKKSYAKVVSEARRKKNSAAAAVTPSRGGSVSNNAKRMSLQATSPAGGSISSSGSPAHIHRRHSSEDTPVSSPAKANKGKKRGGDGKSTQRGDEKQYAGSNRASYKEEGLDGWTHHRKHHQDERNDKNLQDFSFNGAKASMDRLATSSVQSTSAHGAKQKQKDMAGGQHTSNNNKSRGSNRQNKESCTSAKRPLGSGGDNKSDSKSSPSSSLSFLGALAQVFQVAVGVFQAIIPLLQQSVMFIAYFFAAVAKGIILLGLGLANTFRYAVEEVEQVDGAFLCYLVLYLVPHVCDVLMTCFSLPHYTPHFISALSIYQLCTESSTKLSLSSMTSAPSSPRRGSKRPSKQGPSHTSESKSHELCRLVLWWCRSLLPFNLIMEGFSKPNLSFMMLHDWTRLLLAFVLSLVRANLILSPVAWLSWSLQVFIIVYLPPNFMNGCFLLMMGLATVRLCTVVQQFDINNDVSYGSTNGKHHKE